MEKKQFDMQRSRNADIIHELIDIEKNNQNVTDEMEIVTEKEFSKYISVADKISEKGKQTTKVENKLNKDQIEDAKKSVEEELEKAYSTFNRLSAVARDNNLQGTENPEDDMVLKTQKEVYELYEQLKKRPLTTKEFSDLEVFTKQMATDENIRNYVDLGRAVTWEKINKLKKQSSSKVFMIFKPIKSKFKETLGLIKEENLDKVFENPELSVQNIAKQIDKNSKEYIDYVNRVNDILFESLFEDNFDEVISKIVSLEDVVTLLEKTEKLKEKYDKANKPTKNGLYPIKEILNRNDKWEEYSKSLFETISNLQVMHLKKCYSDIKKYAFDRTSSGTIACRIGNIDLPIAKDHFVDDVALFYKKVEEYENSLSKEENLEENKEKNDKPIILDEVPEEKENETEKEGISPIVVPSLENIKNIEIPIDEPKKEEKAPEAMPSLENIKNIEISIDEPKKEEEAPKAASSLENIKNIEIPIDEPKKEEKVKSLEQLPTIELEEEIKESNVEPATLSESKQAYIEFISCFVDKEEAKELATDENVAQFEASNLGYTKYMDALDTGKIAHATAYEDFVIHQLEKDNGIKYDEPNKTDDLEKDETGDVIVSNNDPVIIDNREVDLSGFDILSDDPIQFADEAEQFAPKVKR